MGSIEKECRIGEQEVIPMDANTFFYQFKQMMKETNIDGGETYFEKYKLLTSKKADPFTKFINKTIIPNIIRSYLPGVSHEYFRIDASGWVSYSENVKEQAKAVGLNPHLWDLMIAVEHENDPSDWNDEVIKLAHIRCPLKVIIGYNACNERDEGDTAKLAFVADCLQRVRCFHAEHRDELLVILGNGKGSNGQDYDTFDYRGYIYDYEARHFKRITQ